MKAIISKFKDEDILLCPSCRRELAKALFDEYWYCSFSMCVENKNETHWSNSGEELEDCE